MPGEVIDWRGGSVRLTFEDLIDDSYLAMPIPPQPARPRPTESDPSSRHPPKTTERWRD